jgi:hypothetical protein
LKAIVRSSEKFQVRILWPNEFEIIREGMDPDTGRICNPLLLTGIRYAEFQRLRCGRIRNGSTASSFIYPEDPC